MVTATWILVDIMKVYMALAWHTLLEKHYHPQCILVTSYCQQYGWVDQHEIAIKLDCLLVPAALPCQLAMLGTNQVIKVILALTSTRLQRVLMPWYSRHICIYLK